MNSNVLLTIISLILGILIPLLIQFFFDKKFGTKPYFDRDSAKNSMIVDMTKSEEMNFIGISHSKITEYFKEALVFNNNKKLPWKRIHFFFPDSINGRCWDSNFDRKININILQISNFLLDEFAIHLPNIERIYFHNYKGPISFGGSLFKYVNSKNAVDVIYDVQQIAKKNLELKKSRTIRINYSYSKHRMFFKRIYNSFEEIKNDSYMLYKVDCSNVNFWNKSVRDWNYFEQNYDPYQISMTSMLGQIELKDSHNILSLGAGTGEMELKLIEEKQFKGFLGLVDNSYSMLFSAFGKLNKYENVSFSLVNLSNEWKLYGDLSNKKYDYILIHFSVHYFLNNNQTCSEFARKLKEILGKNGEIIIAIHDNLFEGPKKKDKLRKLIVDFANNYNILGKSYSDNVSLEELKNGFINNGLGLIAENEIVIERTMKDRISMWGVEAILSTLLDLSKLSTELKKELFLQLDDLKKEETAPTRVKYLHFSKKSLVVCALIQNKKGEVLTVVKNGYFLLPGGIKHYTETDSITLYRELKEELSIKHNQLEIIEHIGKFNFDKAFIEDIPLEMSVYRCKLKNDIDLCPANEITKFVWLNEEKFNNCELMPRSYFIKIFENAEVILPKS